MQRRIKRILALALTAVLVLSMLPMNILSGILKVKSAGVTNRIVLFDDAFSADIKSTDTSNVTVTDNITGADGNPSGVISLAGGWSLCRFGTGTTAIDITPVVTGSGNLVFDMYASYATADAEIRVYTAAWQNAKVSFFKALELGWNTITIPASEIGSNDFYGIGIVSHTGTCYLDNVRFEWEDAEAVPVKEEVILFDNAFTDHVTGHHESLTVVDDPNAADNKVLQVGNNYARLWMQNTAGISLTEAKANSGKLVVEFYAQSAAENTLDVFVLNNASDTYNGQEFLDFTVQKGWNTIEIPAADITADTIYGLSIYSGIWTKTENGVYHYIDNVRIEWNAQGDVKTIQIDRQPVSAEVQVGESADLCVLASLSDGSDASALRYQWYQCEDAEKSNPAAISGANADAYGAPTHEEGTCYYYCEITAEGIESVNTDVVSVTVTAAVEESYLFQDAYAEGVTGENVNVSQECLKPTGGWAWMKLNYAAAQDWSEAAQYNGSLAFDLKSGWFSETDATRICIYADGTAYEVSNTDRVTNEWNKVSVALSDFGISDFTKVTGIGIMTYASGDTTYIDNVRLIWEVKANTILLGTTPPNEILMQENTKAELQVEATVSDGSEPRFQWYHCESAGKENAQPIDGAVAAVLPLSEELAAGTYYYYCSISANEAYTVSTRVFTVKVGNYADAGTNPEDNASDSYFRPLFGEDYILSEGTAFEVQQDATGTYLVTGQNTSGNWSQEITLSAGSFNGTVYGSAYGVADREGAAIRFRVRFPQGVQEDLLYRVSVINPALEGKESWRTISFTVDFADKLNMKSTDWQEIEIPLDAFTGSASYWDPNDANADKWGSVPVEFDWNNIIGVSFTQTVPAGAEKDTEKAMHIDSVAFCEASEPVKEVAQPLSSDRWIFNDALVGNNSIVNGPYPFRISEAAKRGTYALAMTVENGKSANAQIKLSPKMSLSSSQMYNAALRFWVKLPGDGGVYNISLGNDYSHVEQYATASVTVGLAAYASTLKSGWQEIVIPLSDFRVQAQYWSNSQRKLVNCDFDFAGIDSISIGSTAKTNGTIYIDDLYFDYGYAVNNNGNTGDLQPGATVLQMVYGDSFGANTLIKGQYNYRITTGDAKVGNAKLEITHPWDNAEWYVRFPKVLDLSDEEIVKNGAIEFWVKLNGEIGWYNCYLFNQRGQGATNLGRTSVSINDFVNKKKIGQWQKVQIPLSYFTTNGKYVDDRLQLQDWEFDFSCVVGMGIAQLAEKDAPTDPLVMYDDVKITLGNLPDTTLGIEIIPQNEFDAKNITFTKLDLKPYMTTGFADQTAGDGQGGWTDQGATNDLSSFTLRGEQYFESVPFDIVEPNDNDGKSAIGLRQFFGGVFTDEVTIPVGQKAAGVYILHAFSYDDSLIATYTFQYADGTAYDVQIMKNQQIFNWWGNQESDVVRLIWTGANQDAAAYNMPISLGMFPCENPYPDKEIASIRLKSETEDCAAMVLAMTLADKGLYLPETQSIYNPDTSDWYVYEQPDYDKVVGTALDVSYVLDAPAGKHGYVQAKGDSFVFEDGTKALFWGTNNGETSTFQSHAEIDRYVDVLAASGMNMVRLMDIDGGYFRPNIFGFNEDNMTVDAEAMDSLCYFWAKCKEKGIYIQYCLTGVRYPTEAMNHPAYEDLAMGFKTEIYFDEQLMELTKDLEKTILTWENPYTGTTLATDPCVAMLEINNESNLVSTFGSYSGTAYEITSEYEKALFRKLFNQYLKEVYGTNEALLEAWTSEGKVALREGENLDDGTVVLDEKYKNSNFSRKRVNDSFAFLYKLQTEYHTEMIRWLKEDLGVKAPITGTQNLPSNDRADIYENAHFDYLARHQYESHPQSGTDYKVGAYSGSVNSIILNPESSSLAEDAARKVTGIPYIVNELQMSEPNMYISEFYLVTSAIFAYQGWSGLNFPFTTAEMDDLISNKISDFFQVMGHPLRYGTLPSASLLYHRNEITQAEEGYYTSYTEKDAMNATNQSTGLPENSFIVGAAGINMESATGVVKESSAEALEKINHQTLVNENGEIIWTPKDGHFFIDTDKTQAAAGTLAGETVSLDHVEITTDTYFVNITVSALGLEDTIANAENILITAAARARNTGARLSVDGKTIKAVGKAPILVEQVEGTVTIKNTNTYEVYILNSSGERIGIASTHKDENGYTVVEMKQDDHAMHYELVKVTDGEKNAVSAYGDVSDSMATAVDTAAQWLPALTGRFYGVSYNVERGDFVAALVRAFGLKAENASGKYGDVEDAHQGAAELKIAKALKLVRGTRLEPYTSMTRADAWVALYNTMIAAGYTFSASENAALTAVGDYAALTEEQQTAISALMKAGFITAADGETVTAAEAMTRGEAALLLAAAVATAAPNKSANSAFAGGMDPVVIGLIIAGIALVAGAGVFGVVTYRKKKKSK